MARPASKDYLQPGGKDADGLTLWEIKLQYSPKQRFVARTMMDIELPATLKRSMRTSDRELARRKSENMVRLHKAIILLARACTDPTHSWGALEVPNDDYDYTTEAGYRTRSQDGALFIEGPDGKFIFSGRTPQIGRIAWNEYARKQPEYIAYVEHGAQMVAKAPVQHYDTAIVENYILLDKQADEDAKLLRKALGDWRVVAKGKTFATATRLDARLFIDHLRKIPETGNRMSVGRAERIVSALSAAVSFEMLENGRNTKIKENIFYKQKIQTEEGDKTSFKTPYGEDHLAKIKANRHVFSDSEWMMIVFHISTGIRMEGIFSIREGFFEIRQVNGETLRTRSFFIGKDKDSRKRKVLFGPRALPYPNAMLNAQKLDSAPLLPDAVSGTLFPDESRLKPFLQRINYKLRKIGVNNPEANLVLYSGRHRADQRMQVTVPEDHRRAILGHVRTVDAIRKEHNPLLMYGRNHYGHKFQMWQLKPSIDQIGF